MRWYRLIDMWSPQIFSPKVTPDPTSAARLDEKLQLAMRKLKHIDKPTNKPQPLP